MSFIDPESKVSANPPQNPSSSLPQDPVPQKPSIFSVSPSSKAMSKEEKSYLKKQKREKLLETVKASLKSKGKDGLIQELLDDEKKMKGVRKYFDITKLPKPFEGPSSESSQQDFTRSSYFKNHFHTFQRKNGKFPDFRENPSEDLESGEGESMSNPRAEDFQNIKKYNNQGFIPNKDNLYFKGPRPDFNSYNKYRSMSSPQGMQYPVYQAASSYRGSFGGFNPMHHFQRPHAGYQGHYQSHEGSSSHVVHPSAHAAHAVPSDHPSSLSALSQLSQLSPPPPPPPSPPPPGNFPHYRYPYNPYRKYPSWIPPNEHLKFQNRALKNQRIQECLEGYFNYRESAFSENSCESCDSSSESLSSINFEYGIPAVPEMKTDRQDPRKEEKRLNNERLLDKNVNPLKNLKFLDSGKGKSLQKPGVDLGKKIFEIKAIEKDKSQKIIKGNVESEEKETQCNFPVICESCQSKLSKSSKSPSSSQSSEKNSKVSSQFSFTAKPSSSVIPRSSEVNLESSSQKNLESFLPLKRPGRGCEQDSSMKYLKTYENFLKINFSDSETSQTVPKESKSEMISKIIERTSSEGTFPLNL